MRIGILSDTHDHKVHTKVALSMLRNLKAELLLHAGDFCAPFMVPFFDNWTLHAVFGNNDGDHFRIQQKFAQNKGVLHGDFMDEVFGGKRVAMYHGTQPGITEALIKSGMYDLVVTGHTHVAVNEAYRHPLYDNMSNTDAEKLQQSTGVKPVTLHVNPGTVNGLGDTATFALYDTATGQAEIIGLD